MQLADDLRNLELGKKSRRLKAARTGRSLDIAAGYFRGEVIAAVRYFTA